MSGADSAVSLDSRVIVVTGAGSGIGSHTSLLLQERGAEVIGVDLDPSGAPVRCVQADLSTPTGIDRAVQQLPAQIDGLCAIAGVPGTAGLETVRAVNYLGVRHLADRVLDRMRAGGSIAVASSVAGSHWRDRAALHSALDECYSFEDGLAWSEAHPSDDVPCYPYFKEALVVWAMRAAARLNPRQIRVNCVSPGPVDTPILRDFRTSVGPEVVERDIDRVGRVGRTADVAGVFAFLMSADSAWVSGVDVACDGGLAAMNATAEAQHRLIASRA